MSDSAEPLFGWGNRFISAEALGRFAKEAFPGRLDRELTAYWEDRVLIPTAVVRLPEEFVRWETRARNRNRASFKPIRIPKRYRSAYAVSRVAHTDDGALGQADVGLKHPLEEMQRAQSSAILIGNGCWHFPRDGLGKIKVRIGEVHYPAQCTVPLYDYWQAYELHAVRRLHFQALYDPRPDDGRRLLGGIPRKSRFRLSRLPTSIKAGRPFKAGDPLGIRDDARRLAKFTHAHRVANVMSVFRQSGSEEFDQDGFLDEAIRTLKLRRVITRPWCVSYLRRLSDLFVGLRSDGTARLAESVRRDMQALCFVLLRGYGIDYDEATGLVGSVRGQFAPALPTVFEDERYRVVVEHAYLFEFLSSAQNQGAIEAETNAFLEFLEQHNLEGLARDRVELNSAWFSEKWGYWHRVEGSVRNSLVIAEDRLRDWTIKLSKKKTGRTLRPEDLNTYAPIATHLIRLLGKRSDRSQVERELAKQFGGGPMNYRPSSSLADLSRKFFAILRISTPQDAVPDCRVSRLVLATGLARNLFQHRTIGAETRENAQFLLAVSNCVLRLTWELWKEPTLMRALA